MVWKFDVTSGEFANKPCDPSGTFLNNAGQRAISTKTVEKRFSRTRTTERFEQMSKTHRFKKNSKHSILKILFHLHFKYDNKLGI